MTKDLKLCAIRRGDHTCVQRMFIEFNASEFGKYDPIDSTEEACVLAFLEDMAQNHVIFAVTPADSDEMIGYICFHIAGAEYDLGYMIASAYRRAGIATAGARMAIERVNQERGAKIFTATVASENVPSVRVLEKLGFTLRSETRIRKEANGAEYTFTERHYTCTM